MLKDVLATAAMFTSFAAAAAILCATAVMTYSAFIAPALGLPQGGNAITAAAAFIIG